MVVREAIEALVLHAGAVRSAHGRRAVVHARVQDGLAGASWPAFDAEVAKADEITVPVQVNGKVRGRLTVPAATSESELESAGARRSGGAGAHQPGRR